MEFAAPFMTVVTILLAAGAVWRLADNDSGAGSWLVLMTIVALIYTSLGWHYRRSAPEDRWEPR